MTVCPRCGFRQEGGNECSRCGVVYRKFLDRKHLRPSRPTAHSPDPMVWTDASPRTWKKKALLWFLVLAALVWAVSLWQRDGLPAPEAVLADLYQEPHQAPAGIQPFETTVGDVTYTVTPRYLYELRGLVVSFHDATAWWDLYHNTWWSDFLNLRDLCVVWGDNIRTGAYLGTNFSSGVWTCEYWYPAELVGVFRDDCLSNNHILSDRKDLNRELRRARDGDQIYLRGYLAEYSHGGGFRRGTSTTRQDTGNGACETIWLEDFRILRRANPVWRALLALTSLLLPAGAVLWFFVD